MKEATCDPTHVASPTGSHMLIRVALQLFLFPWTSDPPFCLPPTTCQATRCDLSYPVKTSRSRHPPIHLHTFVSRAYTAMPFMPLPSTAGSVRGIGSIEFGFPSISRAMAFGITFAVAGNILISFALNLQKLAHARLEEARAGRGHGLDVMDQEGGANHDVESAGIEVPRESGLPPELEREARVWSGNSSEASLTLGSGSETDPLMAPVAPNAVHIHAVPTYGALFPNADEIHVRRVESSPLRQPSKTAERPGTRAAAEFTNRQIHHESNNESEYLKSKLWYALPVFLQTARVLRRKFAGGSDFY